MSKITLVLTGPHAGKTVVLNRQQFVNGECTLDAGDNDGAIKYFGRCYQAYPKGSAELVAAQAAQAAKKGSGSDGVQRNAQTGQQSSGPKQVSGDGVQSAGKVSGAPANNGSGSTQQQSSIGTPGMVPAGSGHQDSGLVPEQVTKIRQAVAALDSKVDAQWSEDGKPSVEVLAQMTGIANLSRAMIDAVAPDVTRAAQEDDF